MVYLTDYIKFKTSRQMLQTKISHKNQILFQTSAYYTNTLYFLILISHFVYLFKEKKTLILFRITQYLHLEREKQRASSPNVRSMVARARLNLSNVRPDKAPPLEITATPPTTWLHYPQSNQPC